MLNKICDLEDQIENLNDLTKKLKERVYFKKKKVEKNFIYIVIHS